MMAAGIEKRAPPVFRFAGLEWLYRVKQEPRRLWKRYLTTNSAFVMMVAAAWIREHVMRGTTPARSAGA